MTTTTTNPRNLGVWILMLAAVLPAQSLTTTFAAGNGQAGNMFDLVAINPIAIQSFDVHLGAGTWNLEVYALNTPGSHIGQETNASAWTLIATRTGVVSPGQGTPVPLGLSLGFGMAAGTTQAFYVTVSNGTSILYTNVGTRGQPLVSDANLQFLTGSGNAYRFGSFFQPRAWNGTIHYTLGAGRPLPFQVNQPAATFSVDGVTTTGWSAARSTRCGGTTATLNFSSTSLGMPFDMLVNFAALRSRFASTSNGQMLNLDIFDPSFLFLSTGQAGFGFGLNYGGPLSLPLATPPLALTLAMQMVVVDPSMPDGFALSQGGELVLTSSTPVAGPTGDDTSVTVVFQGSPLCAAADVTFYGTVWTRMFVSSNGRVVFGAADTDFSPSVAEALTDGPMVGAWADFNPGLSASPPIVISVNANGEIQIDYGTPSNGLAYFGGSPINSFQVRFDLMTGMVVLDGLTGITPGTGSMLLGLSGGSSVLATDTGPESFASGAGSTSDATRMLYEFGTEGTLASGMTTILFVPNGFANYDWLSL